MAFIYAQKVKKYVNKDVILKLAYYMGGGEMKNFFILTDAINYIEDNICEKINSQMVADYCYVSLSSLQKLFRLALHKSVKEYISKRRMSLAAKDLLDTDMSIIEIAYKYRYSSPEVFCRAFRRIWHETPSNYRKKWRFSDLFPKIDYRFELGGDEVMARKKVDITDAYETFKNMKGTYVICFDIVGMMKINDISREAGDLVIVEAAKRIDEKRSDEMLMFRIGGDEFALVTGLTSLEETEKLANEVLEKNGMTVTYKDKQIPLSLRAGFTKIPEKSLRYSEFFTNLHQSIEESRNKNKINK